MSEIDDTLDLPTEAEVRLLTPDILVLRSLIPEWRDELIRISEKIQRWSQSSQSYPDGSGNLTSGVRDSRSFMLSVADPEYGPCFRRFEEALLRAFHSGLLAYKGYNKFLEVTHDSGFEMLRYQEGQKFELHCDTILGRQDGLRQLTGLVYLNDDYTGGETHFPRQGLKFKGTAGDLLLFPSSFCYPHESLPVTEGTKYAIVTWFMAYPKTEQNEEAHGEQGEDRTGSDPADADGGVRLHGSTGSGSPAGEPEASDREHSASVGGRAGPGSG